ncbi:MAG TPA: hypothetical protein VF498_01250 [Anaerolineales bacterium]
MVAHSVGPQYGPDAGSYRCGHLSMRASPNLPWQVSPVESTGGVQAPVDEV